MTPEQASLDNLRKLDQLSAETGEVPDNAEIYVGYSIALALIGISAALSRIATTFEPEPEPKPEPKVPLPSVDAPDPMPEAPPKKAPAKRARKTH